MHLLDGHPAPCSPSERAYFSRRGGRRSTRGGGGVVRTELQTLEDYLAKNLFSWMRADARTEAASKVTSFSDKVLLPSQGGLAGNARSIDPNHAFAQATGANQVAAITNVALANNRPAADFSGVSGRYPSTLAASGWTWAHNGLSALRAWTVCTYSSSTSFAPIWGTADTSATPKGVLQLRQGGSRLYIGNGTASLVDDSGQKAPTTTNQLMVLSSVFDVATSPVASLQRNGTLLYSAATTAAAPATSDAAMPMEIGPGRVASSGVGYIADIIWSMGALNAVLNANVARYILLRYGLIV